jgi:hypothetical protein
MIEQDQACRFFPATALVQLLQKAKASFELPAVIQKLGRNSLLVIDDISYVRRSELETSVLRPWQQWTGWCTTATSWGSRARATGKQGLPHGFLAMSMRGLCH